MLRCGELEEQFRYLNAKAEELRPDEFALREVRARAAGRGARARARARRGWGGARDPVSSRPRVARPAQTERNHSQFGKMWTFGPHNNRRNRHRYDETVQHPVRDPDADKAIGADYEKVGVCAIGCGNIGQICLPTVAEQRRRKKEEIRSRHGDVTRFIDGPEEARSARKPHRVARARRGPFVIRALSMVMNIGGS